MTETGKPPLPIAVLASGSGTNFESIAAAIDRGELHASIRVLVCNRPAAAVLGKAGRRGIETRVIPHRDYASREAFDAAVADVLGQYSVELVVMAGFDRVVTPVLLRRFAQRVINVHPALLPAFRGAHAQAQAAEYGVTIAGATVHFVDEAVDHGPIILQAAVPVAAGEDAETVRLRILEQEHRIYPYAIQLFAEGRLSIEGRRVIIDGLAQPPAGALISPPLPERWGQRSSE
ncbi:MAG TPA: phosphoribosylglycinamide formyltransferase [Candidatus Limnocylindrales bacterium]|nr:phosphoribosylglycinamide formyltransferase [Candidatus Limnocylindrales bacterium]